MLKKYWIKCPICNGKTRVQVFHNTVLKDFPLFCPKCKLTHIIDVEKLEIVIKNTEKQTFIIYKKGYKNETFT
ncbi:cysteine-rich KTR domain-containing protein [Qiania dongpingensis]|uniref:Conjugal transfer protein n=89 Tax=Bacteria TaxID=2 RepID=A0A7G9G4M9_9FIRM|nr:cysteine-rich KTR domain-containing protein [Qiania dongpingensis]QNM05761.1 conjugal transfer protein [Qiania dongpingensis]